jgi:transcriptional regulator with XRE-family HTH domain
VTSLTGNKLRTLRISRGWSQEVVADKINVTQAAYSKLELGQVRLTLDRARELSELYKVNPEYFFIDNQSEHYNIGKFNVGIGTINTERYYESSEFQPVLQHYEEMLADKNNQIKLFLSEIENLQKERDHFWKLINSLTHQHNNKT